MKNSRPIFLCGFARGGSNIFLNFLLSHPDACSPAHEFQEVFLGDPSIDSLNRRRLNRYLIAAPLVILARQNFLNMSTLMTRRKFSALCEYLIDSKMNLAKSSARSRHESQNKYKSEGLPYTPEEVRQSRIVTKLLNGLVLLTENLASMYPDATFYGLVRDGLAVCEGHVRRGLLSAEDFAVLYKKVGDEMLVCSRNMESFYLHHFDDVLSDPIGTIRTAYGQADLDISQVAKIRLQSKTFLNKSGVEEQRGDYDRQLLWYSFGEVVNHFQPDIDATQKDRLTKRDRNAFLKIAGDTMERFGYSTT